MDDMTDEVFADAREEGEDDDIVVETEMGRHWLGPVGRQDAVLVIGDVDTGIDEVGVVERLEGIELLGALLRGAVAAQQMTSEVDADLGHEGMTLGILGSGDLDSGDEVFLAVGAQLTDGQLGAREDDGLREVLKHIGEGRGGIGHRVGAMEHHESVVVVVAVGDAVADVGPSGGRHVAGVDGWRELIGLDLGVELLEFGHMDEQMLEVEGLEGTRLRVAVHADRAACIDEKYLA